MKDPENPKRWVVDEEAAQIVRRIYTMSLGGLGTEQIAAELTRSKVPTPSAYWKSKGVRRSNRKEEDPCAWQHSTVIKILSLQEYCGDVLNFKTYSKSYKNKKRLINDPENVKVFQNVHDPVVDRNTWEKVQKKRGKVRKRATGNGEKNIFSGFLVCPDCGSNLHYHFNQKNPDIQYFNCAGYNKGSRKCCTSSHYIRVDFLEQVVLSEIRRLTKYVCHYEETFVKAITGYSQQAAEQENRLRQKELKALAHRDRELDILFEKIYEDNVSGKISDNRFSKMSQKYEEEQRELSARIRQLQSECDEAASKGVSTDAFVAIVRKYTRARKLTQQMLSELIDYIEVYQAEKVNGIYKQKLVIHYNCITASGQ